MIKYTNIDNTYTMIYIIYELYIVNKHKMDVYNLGTDGGCVRLKVEVQ